MTISPLDDRYRKDAEELIPYVSEMALMKYRVHVEVEYLIALGEEKEVRSLTPFSRDQKQKLRRLVSNFSSQDFESIKGIEEETHHDVKAVEYFLRRRLDKLGMGKYEQWVHFALTSEDVNNIAYALMWQEAVADVYLPVLNGLLDELKRSAKHYRSTSMLALTHGQPATPTSLGKELAVYGQRLKRQVNQLKNHILQGKLSGATGTWSGHVVTFPDVDWLGFTREFISSLGLDPNLVTTQIESGDALAESYHILSRINTILIDFCRDLWLYISRGIFRQEVKAGEVGSSTMPHKVNPIHFENAEGNLGLANAYLSHLSQTLPVSRLQRDLSGSTVVRNQGVPLAHSLLGCKNIQKGLMRIVVDEKRIGEELDDHWEVLTEAIQTVLRKRGDPKAFEQLKEVFRGEKTTREEVAAVIEKLEIPESEKEMLLSLSPGKYTGLASKIVDQV